MPREFDFTGQSGTTYRYLIHDEDRTPSPAGGNFLYVRMVGAQPEVIYAGETESLYRGVREEWHEAHGQHGATAIFLRLNVTGDVRRAEQADLIAYYKPVMNNN